MRRIFVDKITNNLLRLEGQTHHHFAIVLRAKRGERVEVACGDGYVYECVASEITKTNSILEVQGKRIDNCESDVDCTLFFALQKGDRNEITVQKAVELGVNCLVPLHTTHTVAQKINTDRLNKIAAEAAGQCSRNHIPSVNDSINFDELLNQIDDFDLVVFPYEKAQSPSIKQFLRSAFEGKKPQKIAVIVGAEGGFSPEEAAKLAQKGVTPISLGERILRAETACIACLCCVMYESNNLHKKEDNK